MKIDKQELAILQTLDKILRQEPVRKALQPIIRQAESNLERDAKPPLAWEPVPLSTFPNTLPHGILSSWVFAIRAGVETGPERHPNSRQRMVSYQGTGDLQILDGGKWQSNHLISDYEMSIEKRWVFIPPNTWHQAVTAGANWIVVSFHTVLANELIEERPAAANSDVTQQRRYV